MYKTINTKRKLKVFVGTYLKYNFIRFKFEVSSIFVFDTEISTLVKSFANVC